METFPLNKVLKETIQTVSTHEKPTSQHENLSSKSVPKVVRSEEAINQNRPKHSSTPRPKTCRERLKQRASSADRASLKDSFVDSLTWNDVFLESPLSSSEASSDIDSNKDQQDTEVMRRQLIREMFTQEEEALWFRLAKEKEIYYSDMRWAIKDLDLYDVLC